MVAKEGTQQPLVLENLDDDEADLYVAHQQLSHFSDGKAHNEQVAGVDVDIGLKFGLDHSPLQRNQKNNV